MQICFQEKAWGHYQYWQKTDRKVAKKINQIINDIKRNPYSGLGKPEPLRHELSGYWSRRIDGEHRLVYTICSENIVIVQCRYHY